MAWSNEEVAQYLVTFKQFEHKSADTLKERVQQTYHDQLAHVLTNGKKVNKTDADNLAAEFGVSSLYEVLVILSNDLHSHLKQSRASRPNHCRTLRV